jgi:GNAT superfamily N-acetyltransferase
LSAPNAEEQTTEKPYRKRQMCDYKYITLREKPEIMEAAATWFHSKWHVPREAYLECMVAYLNNDTEYGWYLCLNEDRIVGGLGVIENDFHDRKDLAPNVCAVYTDEDYRCQGIAGRLLNMAVEDLRTKGISPAYLLTNHNGFYERYGWEFLCMAQGDGEPYLSRMYIHQ